MLIELLVAFAVVAIILTAVYRTVGQSAVHARAAESRRFALMVAESRLAAVGSEIPATPGSTQGLTSGLGWQVDIAPMPGPASQAGRLLSITVRVSERGAQDGLVMRSVTLGAGS